MLSINMNRYCSICKRELEIDADPLSIDCGGHCWGCVGEVEADGGFQSSLVQVRKEFSQGLRDNWMPSPEISFCDSEESRITVNIKLVRPLGDPWGNEEFTLNIFHKLSGNTDELLESVILSTNEVGECAYKIQTKLVGEHSNLWCQLSRKSNCWARPIRVENSA